MTSSARSGRTRRTLTCDTVPAGSTRVPDRRSEGVHGARVRRTRGDPQGAAQQVRGGPRVSGRIRLDRTLFTSTQYPADYGYIENTLGLDGDPLDALVLLQEPTFPGCLIRCRAIGMFRMTDEAGGDDKVLCVPATDPRLEHLRDISHVSKFDRLEIQHFFRSTRTSSPASPSRAPSGSAAPRPRRRSTTPSSGSRTRATATTGRRRRRPRATPGRAAAGRTARRSRDLAAPEVAHRPARPRGVRHRRSPCAVSQRRTSRSRQRRGRAARLRRRGRQPAHRLVAQAGVGHQGTAGDHAARPEHPAHLDAPRAPGRGSSAAR